MFSKSNPEPTPPAPPTGPAAGGPAPEPRPAASPAIAVAPASAPARLPEPDKPSVLGPDLRIRGGIEGRGEIQLQGRAWGDVRVERLIVAETAELEGSVVAVTVEVRGRVSGGIEAQNVRLLPSARVEGDITYEQLQIEAGAQFEGRCIRGRTEPAVSPKAEAPRVEASRPAPAPAGAKIDAG